MKQLSGKNVSFALEPSGIEIEFEDVNLNISDSGKVVSKKGRPNGYVDGEIAAEGDVTLDWEEFEKFLTATSQFGAIKSFPPQDLQFFGKVSEGGGSSELDISAFGCKFSAKDILNAKASGGEKMTVKIGYQVSDPKFVEINGQEYEEWV